MERVAAFKAVIGPSNQDYYLSYFRRCEERGYAPISWNWPVLFLGIGWLLWRRQYRWVVFTLLLGIGSSIIAQTITEQTGSESTGTLAAYLLAFPYACIYLPLKANAIYYDWCVRMIDASNQLFSGQPEQQKTWLSQKGSVNQSLPLVLIVILLLLTLLSVPVPELASQ